MNALKTGLAGLALVISGLQASGQETEAKLPVVKDLPKLQAEALYYDAVRARLKGDEKEAEKLFTEVTRIDPEAAGAYYELSNIYERNKKVDKASEYIKKAISLQDGNKYYKEQYAMILADQNKFEEGAVVYSDLAKAEKNNPDYLRNAALFYQRAGKLKEAMAELNKALEKDSNDDDLLMQEQQLYLKMNDVEGAVAIMKKLISNNPQEGRFYAMLAEMYANNKQPEKAAEVYKKMEQLFPDDANVQLSMAEYYKRKGDAAKYHEYKRKAITNKSLDAETQLTLLVPYLQEINADTVRRNDGLHLAEKIAGQHPNDAQVQGVYGDILSLSGHKPEAVEQYKKSLQLDPSRYPVWQNLLYNYTERKDADSLIVYADKALRLFPNQANLHYLKGIAYMNKRELNSAVKSINRAIEMQPEENAPLLAEMYSSLGDVYNLLKQYNLSDSSYEKSLKLEPDNASVLNNYSYYLSVRGIRLEDAERMSKRSLDIRKNEPTFLDTYGWILYKRGKYEQAKEFIEKAVVANPDGADGTLWEHLGDVYYKLNNTEKAVEYWKKAKERGTDNEEIDKKINERKLYE